jgi:hypothetical protein
MRINAAGDVGIGETGPTQALVVKRDSGDAYIDVVRDTQAQGQVAVQLRGGTGGTDWIMYQDTSSDDLKFYGNGADRMVLTDAGSMALGSYDPATTVNINVGATGSNKGAILAVGQRDATAVGEDDVVGSLTFRTRDTSYTGSVQNGVGAQVSCVSENSSGSAYGLQFWTGSTANVGERMRITNDGVVMVGRTSTADASNDYGTQLYPTGVVYQYTAASGNTDMHRWYDSAGAIKARITGVGDMIIGGTYSPSDERLKENIVDAPAGNLDDLRVRSYDWKADGTSVTHGFIAQELEAVAPYAVNKGETDEDMMSVDYAKLVPMLVKEIQDLKAKVEALENV